MEKIFAVGFFLGLIVGVVGIYLLEIFLPKAFDNLGKYFRRQYKK